MSEFRDVEPREKGEPATPAAIELIERTLGYPLTDDYRDFLMQMNGCELPYDFGVPIDDEYFEWKFVPVTDLYNITPSDDESITGHLENFNYHLRRPEHVFPIGENGYFQRLSISLDGEDRGTIYVWDPGPGEAWGEEDEYATNYDCLCRVADSLTHFWDMLQPLPENWMG